MRRQARPAGAKPGECSTNPASISPRANASSCTSPVASINSSCTRGCASRNTRTQAGKRSNPTVETKAKRSRPASPSALARAYAGKAPARASRLRASGSSAAPAGVSCTLRLVRSNSRKPSADSSSAMACVSGGWVMLRRRAARPKCSSSATATNCRQRRNSISGCLRGVVSEALRMASFICSAY